MNKDNQKYTYTWIALGLMILSGTFLLILSSSEFNSKKILLILSVVSWAVTLASGIYLFLGASNNSLIKLKDAAKPDDVLKADNRHKPTPNTNPIDQLDIQGIAKKIVRRVSPNDNPEKWGLQLLKQFVAEIEIMSGIFYSKNDANIFESKSTYAYPLSTEPYSFTEGEGLTGQVAKNKQISVYRAIPDDYKDVFSGLGAGKPSYLAIVPIIIDDVTIAVIEIAGFKWSDDKLEQLFQLITRGLSEKIQEKNHE